MQTATQAAAALLLLGCVAYGAHTASELRREVAALRAELEEARAASCGAVEEADAALEELRAASAHWARHLRERAPR